MEYSQRVIVNVEGTENEINEWIEEYVRILEFHFGMNCVRVDDEDGTLFIYFKADNADSESPFVCEEEDIRKEFKGYAITVNSIEIGEIKREW